MIDIHCHILPGVDDGSFSLEESLRMADMAVHSGVTAIVATPHCNVPDNPAPIWGDSLPGHLERLRKALSAAGIPLKILQGMEIFGTPHTAGYLRAGKLVTLNQSRYPLVEFPFHNYAEEATTILDEILSLGLHPIVAHPERYVYVQREPDLLNLWKRMGCLLQVNRGSLLGRFGRNEQRTAFAILDRGFASFVASDAHRSTFRTTWLADAAEIIDDRYGPGAADCLLRDNPLHILRDEPVPWIEPDWF